MAGSQWVFSLTAASIFVVLIRPQVDIRPAIKIRYYMCFPATLIHLKRKRAIRRFMFMRFWNTKGILRKLPPL